MRLKAQALKSQKKDDLDEDNWLPKDADFHEGFIPQLCKLLSWGAGDYNLTIA